MARPSHPALPFGYDFGDELHQQHRPSGPPLLTDHENTMMGDFFSNPDNQIGNTTDFGFDFGLADIQQDAEWAFATDVAHSHTPHVHDQARGHQVLHSPHMIRSLSSHDPNFPPALSRQDFSPLANGVQQPFASHFDEGHMGANALLNMSHNSPGLQRSGSRRSSDVPAPSIINPYTSHVLDSARYTPTTATTNSTYLSNAAPIHAPSMASFHGVNNTQPWTTSTRPTVIPDALPFDTDQSFTYASSGSNFGFDANGAHNGRRGPQMSNYSPFQPHSSEVVGASMAPPTRVNGRTVVPLSVERSAPSIPTTKGENDQVIKRMRTAPLAQPDTVAVETVHSPPTQIVKGEASSSRRGSSASSRSGDNSTSPGPSRAAKKASARRRQQATGNASTAQPGSGTKRQKLSDAQRKANHIQSEKRRRADMKQGYDQLDKLVPSLKNTGLSKAQVLNNTVIYLDGVVAGNNAAEEALAAMRSLGSYSAFKLNGAS